jgi:hypothetical protein
MLFAEIGYAVAAEERGRGYATAAVRTVTELMFRQTPLRKLIAFVHEGNHASRRVLEKAGYRQEGFLREHYVVNGKPANELLFGILRMISGFEAFIEDAELPFENVLDRLTGNDPIVTDYVREVPARCLQCRASITEKTSVELQINP